MDDEEDIIRKYQRRRRMYLYASFLVCLTGGAFVAAAMGTQNWITADVTDKNATDDTNFYGDFKAGLFQGKSTFVTTQPNSYDYFTVCAQGECLYSCAASKEKREKHLDLILSGDMDQIEDPPCLVSDSKSIARNSVSRRRYRRSVSANEENLLKHPLEVIGNYERVLEESLGIKQGSSAASQEKADADGAGVLKLSSQTDGSGGPQSNQAAVVLDSPDSGNNPSSLAESNPGGDSDSEAQDALDSRQLRLGSSVDGEYLPGHAQAAQRAADVRSNEVSETDGLLSEGLWVGTIACLSGGLLFTLVGAVFAIVNTATTPVEAITGVTGLYVWNGLAGGFELVAVILWAVMFSSRLSHNVLVEQSAEGWTTEGNEVLGYSFWLVVVAIFVHIGNCGLIAYGTYEPKEKEKIQEPDQATNDILLY